jgi:hypothetical protein
MSKLKKSAPKAAVFDKMSDWIRQHSGHSITIDHRIIIASPTEKYERFVCHCGTCTKDKTDLFYYMIGKQREKKIKCEECAG